MRLPFAAASTLSFIIAASAHAGDVACPQGDAAGASAGAFHVVGVDVDVDISDGVANVRYRIGVENRSQGPATGEISLSTGGATDDIELGDVPPLVVRRAALRGAPALRLRDAVEADEEFSAFSLALSDGVAPELVNTSSRHRTAVVVEEERRDEIVVKVAAACSVRRATLHVDGAVLSTPRPGGLRFVIPRASVGDRFRVREASGATIWINGRKAAHGVVRVVGASDDAVTDDGADASPVVIDVHAPPTLRATGVLHTRPALKRPVSDADDSASGAPAAAVDSDAVDVPAGLSVLHAAVDVPLTLVPAPAAPRLVFVIDASVSAGDSGVRKSLSLMHQVLDAAPAETRWALVTFARHAQIVVDPWRARDDRFLPAVVVGNGSDVAGAVRIADKIASDADEGDARVVVIGDLQQSTLMASRLPRALKQGPRQGRAAILHVLRTPADIIDDEALTFSRMMPMPADSEDEADTGDDLTQAVTARGGTFLGLRVSGDATSDDETELARALIRPTRLDQPRLFIDGVDVSESLGADLSVMELDSTGTSSSSSLGMPTFLVEGGGLRLTALLRHATTAAPRRAELRGLLWAQPVRLGVSLPDARGARATVVGTVINDELRDELDDDDVFAFASSVGVVSRVTSLAMIPSFRPAEPEGYGRGYGISCGCSCACGGSFGRSGCGLRMGKSVVLEAQKILDARAKEIAAQCRASVSVEVEVGDLELLAVTDKASNMCVAEAWWRTRLDRLTPGDGSFESQRRFTVEALFEPDDNAGAEDHDVGSDVNDGPPDGA